MKNKPLRTKYLELIYDMNTYRKRVKSHCDTPPPKISGYK